MYKPGHVIAIFGGAVAGSEAAERLANQGIHVVVFEQNHLPYGKIESGLPKWHVKLRNSQESKIDQKLKHPLVHFVPGVRLGKDIMLSDLAAEWGFSAILLAIGAWRDRSIPIEGIDAYINKGLYYQNSFVSWFNHNHITGNGQDKYDIPDDAIIIGGGLASFDVIKIVMIETVRKALLNQGHDVDILTLEKKGIAQVLEELDLSLPALGLKGCTLYYRRRIIDMPLTTLPDNPVAKDFETAHRVRQKIFDNLQKKFLFTIKECHAPVDKIVKDGRLSGLIFNKTEMTDGGLRWIEDHPIQVYSPLVISAIGSLPEPVPEMEMERGVFKVEDQNTGKLSGFENVFALGNAVTGRGNIKESQIHGRMVSEQVMKDYLAWQPENYQELFDQEVAQADMQVDYILDQLKNDKILSGQQIGDLISRVKTIQINNKYDGNYDLWIKNNLPIRLENIGSGD